MHVAVPARRTAALLALTCAALLAAPLAAHAAIKDLGATGTNEGDFNPIAVNSLGNVAGTKIVAGSGGCGSVVGHAAIFRRTGTSAEVIGPVMGGVMPDASARSSAAYDINDSNLIAGASDTTNGCSGRHAFKSANGAAPVDLLAAGQPLDYSVAYAVNGGGDIAGFSVVDRTPDCDLSGTEFEDVDPHCPQPATWAGGAPGGALASMDLFPFEWGIRAVADTGRMVGYRYPTGGPSATGYTWASLAGAQTALDNLIPREHGISPNGKFVVGNTSANLPRFWDSVANEYTTLALPAGATAGRAMAVNDQEDIVGEVTTPEGPRAVMWDSRSATPVLLNTLVPDSTGWVLTRAYDISGSGHIVGVGTLNGSPRGFVIDSPLTVTDTGDQPDAAPGDGICDADAGTSGAQCTLRAAIETVNATANTGRTRIEFDLPVSGGDKPIIHVSSPLPSIQYPVEIDGTTQEGVTPHADEPRVKLQGDTITGGANNETYAGLKLFGGNNVVRGLVITHFPGPGIYVNGAGGDVIAGNWIGVLDSGSGYADGGNGIGILVSADNVTIGGSTAKDRNTIAANGDMEQAKQRLDAFNVATQSQMADQLRTLVRDTGPGVLVEEATTGLKITGNYIGVQPSGAQLGNPTLAQAGVGTIMGNIGGIVVAPTAGHVVKDVTIGGAGDLKNVITGNLMGVALLQQPGHAQIDNVDILGNNIGTDAGGNTSGQLLGNSFGITIVGGANNVDIGSTAAPNAIQANVLGIFVAGPEPTNLVVRGNQIGSGQTLVDWADTVKRGTVLGFGKLNFIGLWLVNTKGALVEDNKFEGNLLGIGQSGKLAQGNTFRGNVIGRKAAAGKGGRYFSEREFSGMIGMILSDTGTDVVDRNHVGGNAIGLLATQIDGARVVDNDLDYNLLGLVCGSCHSITFGGGPGQGNRVTRNLIGLLFAHRELNEKELEATKAKYEELKPEIRKAIVEGREQSGYFKLIAAFSDQKIDLDIPNEDFEKANQSKGHVIEGNLIGATEATKGVNGGRDFANDIGVWVVGDVTDSTIGHTAGPTDVSNVIAHNRQAGIWLGPGESPHYPKRVKIRSNVVFDNGWDTFIPGVATTDIDLLTNPEETPGSWAGPTDNDAGDLDDGPNSLQNFPALAGAAPAKAGTTVVGALSTKAKRPYKIEFFASERCNKFGYGGGERLLGSKVVTTDANGNVLYSITVPGKVKVGEFVTATATAENDQIAGLGTSEFSKCAPVLGAAPKLLKGTAKGETIKGTAGPDVIDAGGGNDTISGGGGDDVIIGGAGNDTILPDLIGPLTQSASTAVGNIKSLFGGKPRAGKAKPGNDTVYGGAGNDRILSAGGNDVIDGGAGNDRILGGTGNDRLAGGAGNDVVLGGAGADRLRGDAGNDVLDGGKGADRLEGGAGNDTFRAKDGAKDTILGGPGKDTAIVDKAKDVLVAVEKRLFK